MQKKDRSHLNVHFKVCEGSYAEAFEKMIEAGTISTRGLQSDAKVIDELVLDVNTACFERNGGEKTNRRQKVEIIYNNIGAVDRLALMGLGA